MIFGFYGLLALATKIFNDRLGNSALSCFFVFNMAWVLTAVLFELDLSVFGTLSTETVLYFLVFGYLYTLSYIFLRWCFGRSVRHTRIDRRNLREHARLLSQVCFWCWVALLCIFLWQVERGFGLVNYLVAGGARQVLKDLDQVLSVNISYYICGFLYILLFYYRDAYTRDLGRFDKIKLYAVLFSLVLTAAKMNFVVGALLMYMCWFNNRKKGFFHLIVHALCIVAFFYLFIVVFSLFTGKVIDAEVGSIEGVGDVMRLGRGALLYPYDYLVGSLAAFDAFFIAGAHGDFQYSSHILARAYKFAGVFLDASYLPGLPAHSKPFVDLNGISTNVYTMHYELVYDLGVCGAFAFILLLAYVHAFFDSAIMWSRSYLVYAGFYLTMIFSLLSVISFKFNDTIYLGVMAAILLRSVFCQVWNGIKKNIF